MTVGSFRISEYYRPKHLAFEGVTAHDHSQTDATILAMKAQKMGLKVYSEPGFLFTVGITRDRK